MFQPVRWALLARACGWLPARASLGVVLRFATPSPSTRRRAPVGRTRRSVHTWLGRKYTRAIRSRSGLSMISNFLARTEAGLLRGPAIQRGHIKASIKSRCTGTLWEWNPFASYRGWGFSSE